MEASWISRLITALVRYKYLYLLLVPGILYIIIFCYGPMIGLVISFQDFKITKGVFGSKFVGFDNFTYLLKSPQFLAAFRNTCIISLYKIIFSFPTPILLALLINEIRINIFKRSVQTIIYLPHFLSWVIMYGLIFNLLKDFGPINQLVRAFGGDTIFFLSDVRYFRGVVVLSDIWKEMGWNSIIYLAALAGVPLELYESAKMDGANRVNIIFGISLPYILPTIIIMFLLRIGNVLNVGFEQIISLYNPSVYSVGDIIDTYVFRVGFIQTEFGVSAAAGMFKSVIACIMVVFMNNMMRKYEQESLF